MAVIRVENLTKDFKRLKKKEGLLDAFKNIIVRDYETKTAVDNISFEVKRGEIVGYIGPNGAGKSTSIKMMVGVLVPTSGTVDVNGIVPYKNRIDNAKRIGVVFGQRTQLWWDTAVIESLKLMKHLYKIPDSQFNHNMEIFSDILGIDEFKHVSVRQLSLGQRMRADLCAALLHNPEILYLDEPTIGLDVVVKENIRQFIQQINKERGTTVILTTHDMSDIEKLCNRVMVIDKGRIMYDGGLEQLKRDYGNEELLKLNTVELIGDTSDLKKMGISNIEVTGNVAQINYSKENINSSMILEWFMKQYKVVDFTVDETEIEEIIRKMYGGILQ